MTSAKINFPLMLSNASKHSLLNSKTASFSNNLHKGFFYLGEVLDESSVKANMAQETPHYLNIR